MSFEPPPIQERTTDYNGRFPQVWIRWFNAVSDIITEISLTGVISVNGQTGVVVLDAGDIEYDNSSSGLTATNVQAAIDELAAMSRMITAVSTTYSVLTSDDLVVATSGSFTISLPTPSSDGETYSIKNNGVGVITIDSSGGELIDGLSSVTLSSLLALDFVAYNGDWMRV